VLSHRSDDAPGHAGRLFDHLRARFGNRPVHIDFPQVGPGEDFITATERGIADCGALIVIIGQDWLTSADRNGRRLSDADDIVRLQIAAALTGGVRVVPTLVKGATMPHADSIPEDIGALCRRQAAELRDTRWAADVDDLTTALENILALAEGTSVSSRGRRLTVVRWAVLIALMAGSAIAAVAVLEPTWLPDLPGWGNAASTVAHAAAEVTLAGPPSRRGVQMVPLADGMLVEGADETILVWNLATGESEAIFKGYGLNAVAPASDGRLALGYWGEVRLWNMTTRRTEDSLAFPEGGFDRTEESIDRLMPLSEGRFLSLALEYGPGIWDFKTHTAKRLYEQPIGRTRLALPLSDGRFAFALERGEIKLWNPKTNRAEATLKGHGDRPTGLVATRDGRLVSAAQNGIVELWDLDTATARVLAGSVGRSAARPNVVIGHDVVLGKDAEIGGNVVIGSRGDSRLALLNSGEVVAIGDEAIAVFDLPDGKAERVVAIERRWSAEPVVLADGRLALGAEDGTISLWDPATGTADTILEGHADAVTTVVLLPDGRLASGSNDGTIKIWTVARAGTARR
jgi:WD40 repeat protein